MGACAKIQPICPVVLKVHCLYLYIMCLAVIFVFVFLFFSSCARKWPLPFPSARIKDQLKPRRVTDDALSTTVPPERRTQPNSVHLDCKNKLNRIVGADYANEDSEK